MTQLTFKYTSTSLVTESELIKIAKKLTSYSEHLQHVTSIDHYDFDESSIKLAFDDSIVDEMYKLLTRTVGEKLKYILVLGIGGANLGAKAVYDALFGFADILEHERFPKIIFVDANDPEFLGKVASFLEGTIKEPQEILVNVISKSGNTIETITNLEFVLETLSRFYVVPNDRMVITTEKYSLLWKSAKEKGISLLSIPKAVGGRFSVLSTFGLFPLDACGIDIDALRKGARDIRNTCISSNIKENIAILSASILYYHYQHEKNIHDLFLFHPELESLGKWYRQLMGESIGKEKDINGEEVRRGITPQISIGSTDLHSVGQLYLGGPKDKFTTFVHTTHYAEGSKVPLNRKFPRLAKGIKGKSMSDIVSALYRGVLASYVKEKLPFCEITLPDISPYSLGQFFQFKMIEMMYLGKLMKVNPFDQPNVESYKQETKRIFND